MKSPQKRTLVKKPKLSDNVMDDKEQCSSTSDNTITIDYLGSTDAALDTITFSGIDTITLDTTSNYCYQSSLTSPCTITVPGYTSSGTNSYSTWTTNGTGYTLGSGLHNQATVHINTDGIDIKEGGDIKVDGVSLKEFMTKMEQRLAILVPDPKKLEKFEALKKAYEHYKTMEKLCFDEPEIDK